MESVPISVLLIEDEPDLRETLADLLEEQGYLVEMVASSNEAVSIAKDREFDVVVTDIRTEGRLDGLSALEEVKRDQPDVAGVVITGYSTEDYALRAVKLQVQDYLKKPFELHVFLQRIETIANQKRRSKKEAQLKFRKRDMLSWFAGQIAQHSYTVQQEFETFSGVVESLLEKVSLGKELSQEIEIASSLIFAQETAALEIPETVQATLPPSVTEILEQYHDASLPPNSHSLGTRLIKLSLALAEQAEIEFLADSGEFDQELLNLYRNDDTSQEVGDARSILAVALALEDAGELEQALTTYRLLAGEYPGTRSEVYASLGESRLYRTRGNRELSKQSALRSVELAQRQGPGLAAVCGLQAGILLSRQGEREGRDILLAASRALNLVRDVGGRSLCLLALAHFWDEEGPIEIAARTLVASEFTPEFVASAQWLVRFLVTEKLPKPVRDLLLNKAALECPEPLLECCLDTSLPEESRRAALESLAGNLSQEQMKRLCARLEQDASGSLRAAGQSLLAQVSTSTQGLPTLRVHTLGGFKLFRGEQRLEADFRRKKPRLFLAYLLSLSQQAHTDESLIEVFWPGDPKKGRASLRAALSYLRRQLQPSDSNREVNYFLKSSGQVMVNSKLGVWYDLKELESSLKQFRHYRGQKLADKAVTAARKISKLYSGPFLQDCYMDWAVEIRLRLEAAVTEALLFLSRWCRDNSQLTQGLEYAEQLLSIQPSLEEAHQILMASYISQGRHAEAIRQYERCQKALETDLAVVPSTATEGLREQALSKC